MVYSFIVVINSYREHLQQENKPLMRYSQNNAFAVTCNISKSNCFGYTKSGRKPEESNQIQN